MVPSLRDLKEILSDSRNFYKTLYSKNAAVNPDNFPEFYSNNDLPKLSEQQKGHVKTL